MSHPLRHPSGINTIQHEEHKQQQRISDVLLSFEWHKAFSFSAVKNHNILNYKQRNQDVARHTPYQMFESAGRTVVKSAGDRKAYRRHRDKGNKKMTEEKTRIGFQGVRGAFSEAAVRLYFDSDEHNDELKDHGYETVGYSDFIKMLQDVNDGTLDMAFFPVENTTTGIIARTYDYFQYYNVYAIGEVVEPIVQNLIVIPGTRPEEIRTVYSHPEALSQCSAFFRKNPEIKTVSYEDTALAVEYVKNCGDKSKAAIASELAAEINDMEILEPHVQNSDSNMTRFLVLSSSPDYPENANKVSVYFVTRHTPAALYNALGVFASLGIDVLRLECRPIATKRFEYCHYVDFRGNLNDPDVEEALRRLRYDCRELIVLGNYKSSPLAL